MHAHKLRVNVSDDHRLSLDLPKDFPAGPAEVIVLAASEKSRRVVRVAGALSPDAPVPEHDPIGETLQEMRDKRTERLERLAAELVPPK